ncbi:UDP-glycosyltransferase 91A1-like [Olea europaea var. sylvestris]|uniref:UDP-glycosyltransferase 91A1-like n=1 Tax=Olea europaea var. sylvestris TaxID=158386 RepID=UPI000C1D6FA6|nr:UDP-glycosyltransferase 91A1-like [Olea europaea var. sylvestris]
MAEQGKLHILMFPWLAFGHLIPYLELAKLIAQKGHSVSFVSTPRNIDRLPKLPSNLTHLIEFVKIQLPKVDSLPEDAEATIDVPFDMVRYLKIAFDKLQPRITCLLEDSAADWIIADFAQYWLYPEAAKLNIPCAFFSIFTATLLSVTGPTSLTLQNQDERVKPEDFTVKPKWVPFETSVSMRFFQINRQFKEAIIDGGNVSDIYRLVATIDGCDVVVMRSCYEFEPEWLQLLENIYEKPIIPVGHLPPKTTDSGSDEQNENWIEIKEWLDAKEKGSVVYVAFGSETKPNQDELIEIALGLEKSELPFFWVLRKQRGAADNEVTHLPEGFEERTKGRGVVFTSWVPQLKVLSHESVGGILCHSGLSSVVEALQFGKWIILLPFLLDQGLISSLLEEKKLGHEIARNELDGSFTKDAVANSLRLVMVEEGGKVYREKVKEMREMLSNKDIQDGYMERFLDHLQNHKKA